MNFNLYLDRDSTERLNRLARETGTPRNALVREAVRAWLDERGDAWPEAVLDFKADPAFDPFETDRAELGPEGEDPFAPVGLPQKVRVRQRSKRRPGSPRRGSRSG